MGSGNRKSSSKSSSSHSHQSTRSLIHALRSHNVNTLTELCRIERAAAEATSQEDTRAFQEPMTAAWAHYVTSNQLLTELRGLTPNYPFSAAIVDDALARVRADPESNRSWNLAWLVLVKMRADGLLPWYAASEAAAGEMWGDMDPTHDQILQLGVCFEHEWIGAVERMLRHWSAAPTWY